MSVLRLTSIATASALLAACATPSPAPVSSAPGAYMIVVGKDYDPALLGPYATSLPPIYEKYGGRYVAFSTEAVPLEGRDDYQATIISAWDSVAEAQAFWDSPEYREAIKLRDGIGTFDVVVVPALPVG